MKHPLLLFLAAAALLAPAAPGAADPLLLAGDAFSKANWNDAVRDRQWTADGANFVDAADGAAHSTNGYTVRGGRVGGDASEVNAFAGGELVVEGDRGDAAVPGGESPGTLVLDTGRANGGDEPAVYEANLVLASRGAKVVVQGGNLRLSGSVELREPATYRLNSKVAAMTFHQDAPLTGKSNLTISGGAPGVDAGEKLWVLEDIWDWGGFEIAVFAGNTLRLGPDDASAGVGFSNRGKLRLRDAYLDVPGTLTLPSGGLFLEMAGNNEVLVPDGRYDAAALNALGFGEVLVGDGTVVVGAADAEADAPVESE